MASTGNTGDLTKNTEESSKFNPYLPASSPTDYTNASEGQKSPEFAATLFAQHDSPGVAALTAANRKESDAPGQHVDYVQPVIVDRSKGILFAGLADAGKDAITIGDALYKEHIKSEIQNQVDAIRGGAGVNAAVDLVNGLSAPDDLVKQGDKLKDLKNQLDAGVISESSYWAKMEAMSRQMRSRFPEYSPYVDKVIEDVTGAAPANALRRALLADATSGGDDEVKRLRKLEDQAAANGTLLQAAPDYYTRKAQGNPYTADELNAKIAGYTGNQLKQEQDLKSIDAEVKKGNQVYDNVRDVATKDIMGDVANVFLGTTSTFGQNWEQFKKLSNQIQSTGQPPSPQERQQLLGLITPLISNLKSNMALKLAQKQPGMDWSYSQLMRPDDIKGLNNTIDTIAENLQEGLVNQHWGLLGSANAMLKELQANDDLAVANADNWGRVISSANRMYGPSFVNDHLLQTPEALSNQNTLAFHISTLQMATDPKNNPLATSIDKAWQDQKITDPKYYRGQVDAVRISMFDPKQSPELKAGLAQGTFSEDFTRNFNATEQQKYYQDFTTPAFATEMFKLRDAGKVDAFNAWNDWVLKKFSDLNMGAAHEMQGVVENRPNMKLNFDPKTVQFTPTYIGRGAGAPYKNAFEHAVERVFYEPNAAKALDKVNLALRGLKPILEKEGVDPAQAVMGIFQAMGLNMNAPKAENPTFWDTVRESLKGFGAAPGSASTPTGFRLQGVSE